MASVLPPSNDQKDAEQHTPIPGTEFYVIPDNLPYVTSEDLPGIGGRLKAEPSHFQVTETPLFEPNVKYVFSTHLSLRITVVTLLPLFPSITFIFLLSHA